ncbi:Dabb family protein [Dokdonia sinensis]|uniref:Dabb family protein n=1 Tax=Dokdonia sinensis TaxID=2479847 RepID=A0A3M0GF13_9FLAO|nr:Dabb family protein [Dokdonia sinensis]RMB63505.1 Dabb family protein [Dokdonia sinensis]
MPKVLLLLLIVVLTTLSGCDEGKTKKSATEQQAVTKIDRTLRHIVLFKFKDNASDQEIKGVINAFEKLPSQIEEISAFEWGINNSPEGLNKDLTHSFLVSFNSEKDRDTYLIHPEHLAFVEVLKPHLDDVLVLDYWTK